MHSRSSAFDFAPERLDHPSLSEIDSWPTAASLGRVSDVDAALMNIPKALADACVPTAVNATGELCVHPLCASWLRGAGERPMGAVAC